MTPFSYVSRTPEEVDLQDAIDARATKLCESAEPHGVIDPDRAPCAYHWACARRTVVR